MHLILGTGHLLQTSATARILVHPHQRTWALRHCGPLATHVPRAHPAPCTTHHAGDPNQTLFTPPPPAPAPTLHHPSKQVAPTAHNPPTQPRPHLRFSTLVSSSFPPGVSGWPEPREEHEPPPPPPPLLGAAAPCEPCRPPAAEMCARASAPPPPPCRAEHSCTQDNTARGGEAVMGTGTGW